MISDAQAEHPVFQDFLTQRRAGDGWKLWKLDHVERFLRHMSEVVPTLAQCGVDFKSLHVPLEITTSSGTRLCHLFGVLAALERDLIWERTAAGLTAARQWGRVGGHPPGRSSQAAATALAVEPWYREGQVRVRQLADKLYITKSTFNGARAAGHARPGRGPFPCAPPSGFGLGADA